MTKGRYNANIGWYLKGKLLDMKDTVELLPKFKSMRWGKSRMLVPDLLKINNSYFILTLSFLKQATYP